MRIVELAGQLQKSVSHHPLLSTFMVFFVGVALVLGMMHEVEIAGEVSIVLVKRFKYQAGALLEVGSRLKKELTTWKAADHAHAKPKGKEDLASVKVPVR